MVNGRVTIAAQNNVIVTGDLTINSTTTGNTAIGLDMVGLVAANSVVVPPGFAVGEWYPVRL